VALPAGLHVECRCGRLLGPARENYKEHSAWADVPSSTVGPHTLSGPGFLLREFYCPGCFTLLDVEVVREGAPLTKDVEVAVEGRA
jgi:acetone carboxylase gamma subunit